MILFLPTNSDSEKSLVSEQLGRSNFFYVYNSDEKSGTFFKNSFINENHGAGVKTAEFIVKQKVDVMISPRVGEKALDILLNTNVKMFKSNGKIIKEVIQDFLNQKLEELY